MVIEPMTNWSQVWHSNHYTILMNDLSHDAVLPICIYGITYHRAAVSLRCLHVRTEQVVFRIQATSWLYNLVRNVKIDAGYLWHIMTQKKATFGKTWKLLHIYMNTRMTMIKRFRNTISVTSVVTLRMSPILTSWAINYVQLYSRWEKLKYSE